MPSKKEKSKKIEDRKTEGGFCKDSEVIMTEMVQPNHINALGSIFGGVIMSWIDIAGAIAAQRHTKRVVVTASIDSLSFVAPVYQGWVVNLKAAVNYVAHSSMEVGVRVDAENTLSGEKFHTATAYLTFVALDENGRPTTAPKVIPQTSEEKRRYERARLRVEERLKSRQKG